MNNNNVKQIHIELDLLVNSGDLKSYEWVNRDDNLNPSDELLTLTFPSGKVLKLTSNCGSGSDADSWLEIVP